MTMNVVFRADASLEIGSGHIMRCVSLANQLSTKGHCCFFICRSHPGNLNSYIKDHGHQVLQLPSSGDISSSSQKVKLQEHEKWLGIAGKDDAFETITTLQKREWSKRIDWLIIDHYGIDKTWEGLVNNHVRKTLVIDDLANRKHICNALLDQTFARCSSDYSSLVPSSCDIFAGSQFALLRPEFQEYREASLKRRLPPELANILVTMGGVDKDNITEITLKSLINCDIPKEALITAVMGKEAPWLQSVKEFADRQNRKIVVLSGVKNMAEIMAVSDLCIGAAGSTAWERCCLGLPTITVMIAENQRKILKNLAEHKAVLMIDDKEERTLYHQLKKHIDAIVSDPAILEEYISQSASVTDGKGVERIIIYLEENI